MGFDITLAKRPHKKWIGLTIAIIVLTTACAKVIPEKEFPRTIIPSADQFTFHIQNSPDSIRVLYLGCGHLIILYRQENIVIDPFFSTHGFTKSKLFSDTIAFRKYENLLKKQRVNLNDTKSVWIAHTHYDHMSDLPLLLEKKRIVSTTPIYGNEDGASILQNFLTPQQYHPLTKELTYNPKQPTPVSFINASTSISVLSIRSDHAPHYKIFGLPIHLMKGKLKANYFKKNFVRATDTTSRGQWKEGRTYSYLIDFKTNNHIDYRLFIQTSASHYPLGRPPLDVLRERPVDVAFLCAASSDYVKKKYPVNILRDLFPNHPAKEAKVVWIHWEDFFGEPLEFEKARLVRMTNFKGLGKRLRKGGFTPDSIHQVMPRPGTVVTIK
ncbi:MAG: MBL fold metallo-hydrolase [Bacteroidetes bacterium]|nr:MBL fold metallo-hydrolase [Bacteroidota bacterium]